MAVVDNFLQLYQTWWIRGVMILVGRIYGKTVKEVFG